MSSSWLSNGLRLFCYLIYAATQPRSLDCIQEVQAPANPRIQLCFGGLGGNTDFDHHMRIRVTRPIYQTLKALTGQLLAGLP